MDKDPIYTAMELETIAGFFGQILDENEMSYSTRFVVQSVYDKTLQALEEE